MEKADSCGDGRRASIDASRKEGSRRLPNGENVLLFVIAFRLLNALCVATFFQPDEYFQSLEPAWEIAFGKQSGAWITWEWQHQLRSSLHPMMFATVYSIFDKIMLFLALFPPFKARIFILLPKLFQGVCAAIGDYYTWKLAARVYGRSSNSAWTVLFLTLLSPWQWFCSTRTLSNSFEVTLTAVALYCWPWHMTTLSESIGTLSEKKSFPKLPKELADLTRLRGCLFFAGIACILRPTNLLLWASLVTTSITRLALNGFSNAYAGYFFLFLREVVLCGGAVLSASALLDRLYFGTWTFPPYQWLNFNITQSLAVFYGTNDWHYYLSQGLPLLLTTYLPFALIALWSSTSISSDKIPPLVRNARFDLTFMILTTIATLSLISHKEVRFIYPLLPSLHILAAPHVLSFFSAQPLVTSFGDSTIQTSVKITSWRVLLLMFLLGTNASVGFYTTQVHQRGVIDVLTYLRHEYEQQYFPQRGELVLSGSTVKEFLTRYKDHTPDETFAAFLMPCHSTPWRSHLIYPNLHAWALTCEPPLHIPANTPERATYRDEADRFYDDTQMFLKTEIGVKERPWPRYIVGFEGIRPTLETYLAAEKPEWRFREKWSGFNSHWHDDGRRFGNVIVWELTAVSKG